MRSLQREYVDLWAGQLRLVHADLGLDRARAMAHAAFGLINSTPHSKLLPRPPDARAALHDGARGPRHQRPRPRPGRRRPALTTLLRRGGRLLGPGRRAGPAAGRPAARRRGRSRRRRPRGRRGRRWRPAPTRARPGPDPDPDPAPRSRACSRASSSSRGSPRSLQQHERVGLQQPGELVQHGQRVHARVHPGRAGAAGPELAAVRQQLHAGLLGVLDQQVRQVAGQQGGDPAVLPRATISTSVSRAGPSSTGTEPETVHRPSASSTAATNRPPRRG